jgi:hypothetical protein
MKKEECTKLWEEYLSLKGEMDMAFQARDYNPHESMVVHPAPPYEHMLRFEEVKKVLQSKCIECLELSPSDAFELEDR